MTLTKRGENVGIAICIALILAQVGGLVWFLVWLGQRINTGGFVAFGLVAVTVALIVRAVLRAEVGPTDAELDAYSPLREEAAVARAKRHV